jgi:hypothetical protein
MVKAQLGHIIVWMFVCNLGMDGFDYVWVEACSQWKEPFPNIHVAKALEWEKRSCHIVQSTQLNTMCVAYNH